MFLNSVHSPCGVLGNVCVRITVWARTLVMTMPASIAVRVSIAIRDSRVRCILPNSLAPGDRERGYSTVGIAVCCQAIV
jgi:hypothetical protein